MLADGIGLTFCSPTWGLTGVSIQAFGQPGQRTGAAQGMVCHPFRPGVVSSLGN